MKKLMIFLLVILTSIILVSADFGYNNLGVPQLPPEINYSKLIVNLSTNYSDYSGYATNSGQLEGRDTATLVTYLQGLYDLVYCKLTGCTMTGDIDMSGNDITGVSRIMNDYPIGGGYIDVSSDPILITGADLRIEGNTDLMASLYIDDDLIVDGNITAGTYFGDGSQLTGVGDVFNNTDGEYNFSMKSSYDWETTGKTNIRQLFIDVDSNSPTNENVAINITQRIDNNENGYGIWAKVGVDAGLGQELYSALFFDIEGDSGGSKLKGMEMNLRPSSAVGGTYISMGWGTFMNLSLDQAGIGNEVWGHKVVEGITSGAGVMTGYECDLSRGGDTYCFRAINGKSEFQDVLVLGDLNATTGFITIGEGIDSGGTTPPSNNPAIDGADTLIKGQDGGAIPTPGAGGDGGDVTIQGSAGGTGVTGQPGSPGAVIIKGTSINKNLLIRGGSLDFFGGVNLGTAPFVTAGVKGGDITYTAGAGQNSQAGPPPNTDGPGGELIFTAGDSGTGGTNGNVGGNIEFTAGAGTTTDGFIILNGTTLIGRSTPFTGGNASSILQIEGNVSIEGTIFTFSPTFESYSRSNKLIDTLPKGEDILDNTGHLNYNFLSEKEKFNDTWIEYPYTKVEIYNGTEYNIIDYSRPVQKSLMKTDMFQVCASNRIMIDELKEENDLMKASLCKLGEVQFCKN